MARQTAVRLLLTAVIAVLIGGLALPATAAATSCIARTESQHRAGADVVVDAVALSGPEAHRPHLHPHTYSTGELVSPARFAVLRYLKGRGPRTIRVGTASPQRFAEQYAGSRGMIAGAFEPGPGEVFRIYGEVGAPASAPAGFELQTPSICGGTRPGRPGSYLRPLDRSRARSTDPAGRPWGAVLTSAGGGLRCLRLRPELKAVVARGDCRRPAQEDASMHVVAAYGAGRRAATAVAVSGSAEQVTAATVSAGGRPVPLARSADGRVALALAGGVLDPGDFEVRMDTGSGARTLSDPAARALDSDPSEEPGWAALAEPLLPGPVPGGPCARVHRRPSASALPWSGSGYAECGDPSARFFFAARQALDTPEGGGPDVPFRTLLFGRGGPDLAGVSVAGPGGVRDLSPAPGTGVFLAVYGPEVQPAQLSVRARFADGTSEDHTGRTEANVLPLSAVEGRLTAGPP